MIGQELKIRTYRFIMAKVLKSQVLGPSSLRNVYMIELYESFGTKELELCFLDGSYNNWNSTKVIGRTGKLLLKILSMSTKNEEVHKSMVMNTLCSNTYLQEIFNNIDHLIMILCKILWTFIFMSVSNKFTQFQI